MLKNSNFDKLLYDKNLSNQYVKRIKTHVNSIFKYAICIGYLQNNPIDKVDITFKQKDFVNTRKLFLNELHAGEATSMKKSNMTINHNDNIFQVEVSSTLDYHGKKNKRPEKFRLYKNISWHEDD